MLALPVRGTAIHSEPLWNRQFVDPRPDHRVCRGSIGHRWARERSYYEQAGVRLRDVLQNHSCTSYVALNHGMEPPIDRQPPTSVRIEKVKVLHASLHTPGPEVVVRGQYGRAYVEGEEVGRLSARRGRRDADSIRRRTSPRKLYVDNWALGGHAFYVRDGQASAACARRRSRSSSSGAASAVRGVAGERACARTCCSSICSPDEGVSLRSAQRCLARLTIAPCTWTSSTAARSDRACPEAYERADPRRDARATRRCSRADE
jgi:glucose-6-phosphate 1-dehydrogenase